MIERLVSWCAHNKWLTLAIIAARISGHEIAIPAALLDQDLDFGFLSYPPANRDLETQTLFRDELVLAMAPGHPLARAEAVTWQQLAREPFLAHAARTPSRTRLDYQLGQEGIALKGAMELPSLEALKRFVAAGAGFAILPRLALGRELAEGSLASPRLKGIPIARDIRVAYRRSRAQSNLAGSFLSLLSRRYSCTAA